MALPKNIHGPKERKVGGSYKSYLKCPIAFLHKNEQQYPGVSTFRMLIHKLYHITDPNIIRHIFQTNHRNYEKGFDQAEMKQIFGESIMTSTGSHWLEMRRRIQPYLHKRKMEIYIPRIVDIMETSLEKLANTNESISLYDFLSKLTLNIVSTCIFGHDMEEDIADIIGEQQELLYKRMTSLPLPLWIPTKTNQKFKQNQQILDQLVAVILENADNHQDGLIGDLREAGAIQKQIKDEIMTLLLAGHETTASVIYFACILLKQHPNEQLKMQAEIAEIISDGNPTWNNIQQLSFTRKIILETMRLYPPVWGTSRQAIQDDEIDEYKIKRRKIINLSPYAMHHSERFWETPDIFKPERFDEMPDKYIYFPFGGGPRKCIGETFAMTEMLVFMTVCFQNYKLQFELPNNNELQVAITLRPKESVMSKVIRDERSGK